MAISGITDFITNSTIYKGASTAAREIKQGALDLIPEAVYSDKKMVNGIKKTGEKISSAEQRLILGASALMSQPFIDANNKRVDEKTRKVSVARTIAKIVIIFYQRFSLLKLKVKMFLNGNLFLHQKILRTILQMLFCNTETQWVQLLRLL